MNLIFPNLQYLEGKTISQIFTANFLYFLRDEKEIGIKKVDLRNMTAEIIRDINLDKIFDEYLENTFKESLEIYHYTTKMLKRGKPTRKDYFKKIEKDNYIQETFRLEGASIIDQNEMNFAWHIAKLNKIRKDLKKFRCVQSKEEKGKVCSVCGLVEGSKDDITEAISLVADKCWKPLGSYEQLKGCVRCAYVLGLISNLLSLWRINILGKDRKTRYVVVPKFIINTINEPKVIDEINEYLNFLGLFRVRAIGNTSIDYIFNSLRAQPIIAKIVNDKLIDLNIYTQSATGQGGYVTENAISSGKVRKIAEFAVFVNKNFPKYPYADGNSKNKISRVLSDVTYLWAIKGKNDALCELFTQTKTNFDLVKRILGGERKMKVEYFKNPEKIKEMNEYEWDNPLVRISTFFVAERANKFSSEGKKPDQAINTPMALFNSIPEKEKTKTIRKFLEEITSRGKSYILDQINKPEEFLSEYSKALNICSIKQLKEIVRYMRMFANTYMYKKSEEKNKIIKNTILELEYEFKNGE